MTISSLIKEQECSIKFKTLVAAKCFRLDKAQTASLLNCFKKSCGRDLDKRHV